MFVSLLNYEFEFILFIFRCKFKNCFFFFFFFNCKHTTIDYYTCTKKKISACFFFPSFDRVKLKKVLSNNTTKLWRKDIIYERKLQISKKYKMENKIEDIEVKRISSTIIFLGFELKRHNCYIN